jgi:hypothetical protein
MSIVFGAIVVSLITLSGYGNTASFPSLRRILVSLPLLFANQIVFNGAYWSLVHEVHFYFVGFWLWPPFDGISSLRLTSS